MLRQVKYYRCSVFLKDSHCSDCYKTYIKI